MRPESPLSELKGIGPKTVKLYEKLGIETVSGLVSYFPRDFMKYEPPGPASSFKIGERAYVYCRLDQAPQLLISKKGLHYVKLVAQDTQGRELTIVYYNQPYLGKILRTGMSFVFAGKLLYGPDGFKMESPERFAREEYSKLTGRLVPVYSLTKGLTSKAIAAAVTQAMEGIGPFKGTLDERVEKKYGFIDYDRAVRTMHFPKDEKEFIKARDRIAVEEFYVFLRRLREAREKITAVKCPYSIRESGVVDAVTASLPYELTNGQKTAVDRGLKAMYAGESLDMLLQGDVGSGKTIVAFLLMLEAVANGHQAAIMAPTEVLAAQHYKGLCELLERAGLPYKACFIAGSVPAAEKKRLQRAIKEHEYDLVVGTHAVFQEAVEFACLALSVTDEQHRFGVRQRADLVGKGDRCHSISLSATPIPRSLASVLYMDMDVCVLDEKPKERLPIKNCVVGTGEREKIYRFIAGQLQAGHQAYVICPLVEESEGLAGENVSDYALMLRQYFPGRVIGVLHGRMKNTYKEKVMADFAAGAVDILVSTTVVEVGVDVKNATVIVIEDAQRFGLASLHQLRGRVGRGADQSYCVFVDTSGRNEKNARLQVLEGSNDGFYIASEDLKMRGPGDLFGIRQSGELEFNVADIYRDKELLFIAADLAKK